MLKVRLMGTKNDIKWFGGFQLVYVRGYCLLILYRIRYNISYTEF